MTVFQPHQHIVALPNRFVLVQSIFHAAVRPIPFFVYVSAFLNRGAEMQRLLRKIPSHPKDVVVNASFLEGMDFVIVAPLI